VLYQPKFCCNCGEKIDRVVWKPWTSRRFCDVCEIEQKYFDLLPRVVVAVGLLIGLFGISGYMRKSATTDVTPKLKQQATVKMNAVSNAAAQHDAARNVAVNSNSIMPDKMVSNSTPLSASGSKRAERVSEPPALYFCGAITKKGTPCSRRVKSPGRCWQHIGQPESSDDAAKQNPSGRSARPKGVFSH